LGTVAVNSGRVEAVTAAASEGAIAEELTDGDEMPAEEAVSVEENFKMVMPVMAKIGKATKVHGNTLRNFELAVITSLFDFAIKSPSCRSFENSPSFYARNLWFVLNPESSGELNILDTLLRI
jgi:hypothetical protein